jgi:menaquinol-cytochrome c reductase iron-sulfur subunit
MMTQPERKSLKPPNPPQAPSAPQASAVPQTPAAPAPPTAQPPSAPHVPPAPQAPSVAKPRSDLTADKRDEIAATRAAAAKNRATDDCDPRRTFFARAAAIAIGAVITIFPFAAGLFFFADPLRRGGAGRGFIKVASLDSVPNDGVPRPFSVVANRIDAWNYFPSEPIGAVFLRRQKGKAMPEAFQTTCPHAGCMIDFLDRENRFRCPCHNSAFQLDGQIIEPSPSPRPMDSLSCEVRDNHGVKEVWVKFESFYTGVAEKIAKS